MRSQSRWRRPPQGTTTHMAPEVLLEGKLSRASDVYAFGILMWELLTADHAFRCVCTPAPERPREQQPQLCLSWAWSRQNQARQGKQAVWGCHLPTTGLVSDLYCAPVNRTTVVSLLSHSERLSFPPRLFVAIRSPARACACCRASGPPGPGLRIRAGWTPVMGLRMTSCGTLQDHGAWRMSHTLLARR
jgi:serine/threonine protein kinase